MIEMRAVRFGYEGGFELEVDEMKVAQGSRICWVGPSGCGKTTLLHLVAGVYGIGSGSLAICGQTISDLSDSRRRKFRVANIGLVFQDFALLNHLSVLDNILLPYRLSDDLRLDSVAGGRAEQLAEQTGLTDKLSKSPSHLSQGERQRVAVCRALITRPGLILADEPTANLDSKNAACVLELLSSCAAENGATLVVVSHDVRVFEQMDSTIDLSGICSQDFLGDARTAGDAR